MGSGSRPFKPVFRVGASTIFVDDLEKIVDLLITRIDGGGDIVTHQFRDQLIISNRRRPAPIGGGGSKIRNYELYSDEGDYLKAKLWSFSENGPIGEFVYIAKPRLLQRTCWDGQTIIYSGDTTVRYEYDPVAPYGRDAYLVGDEEDVPDSMEEQVISPPYFFHSDGEEQVGDIIAAIQGDTGLTVQVNTEDGPVDQPIRLIDTNQGGRAWAVKWKDAPAYEA